MTNLTKKEQKALEVSEAVEALRKLINVNQKVFCSLKSVSSTGMSRQISFYIVNGDSIKDINYFVGKALGYKIGSKGGLVIGGCGMDMGFNTVYNLGRKLFPEGFAVEGRGRNGDTSGFDTDGGYALKHEWL